MGITPGVWSHQVKANYEWYLLSKYVCFSDKQLNIWISQKNKILKMSLILTFSPTQGQGAWFMMWMLTLQGTCGPNMNDFW